MLPFHVRTTNSDSAEDLSDKARISGGYQEILKVSQFQVVKDFVNQYNRLVLISLGLFAL